jgi:hypothetical protein
MSQERPGCTASSAGRSAAEILAQARTIVRAAGQAAKLCPLTEAVVGMVPEHHIYPGAMIGAPT